MIETKNVALSTFSVTIQALHVNGKQMTLSVFRQLPQIDVISSDGTLAAFTYWGYVNYRIQTQGPKLWAVVQVENRLYRSAFTGRLEPCPAFLGIHHYEVEALRAASEYLLQPASGYLGVNRTAVRIVEEYFGRDNAAKDWGPIAWLDFAHCYQDILREKHEKDFALASRINESRLRLLDLPQLFIAL